MAVWLSRLPFRVTSDYVELVRSLIEGQSATAEYAVQMAEVSFSAAFSAMDREATPSPTWFSARW